MGSSVKKGVGKPTLYKTAMKRKNVMLDLETIETLKALGGGNLSEGIRKAAEQLRALDGGKAGEILKPSSPRRQ